MGKDVSRRNFIGGSVAGVMAACSTPNDSEPGIQTRPLGRTGMNPSIIGMGCGGSWYAVSPTEEHALEALNLAIDLGINYLDTGQTYGPESRSETWLGKVLKERRDEVLVATKISVRDPDEARRETDRCLKRLETDHLDVLHIHNLEGEDDLATIEQKGGLIDVLCDLRDQKITRAIGITAHLHPPILKMALERHDFDVTQMALNAAQQGHYEHTSRPGNSFEGIAMPAALAKGIGVIAMKVTGRNELIGVEPTNADGIELIRYALSLPISHAVVGLSDFEHIRQDAELAKTFEPMAPDEMTAFSRRMASAHKASLDRFFLDHQDA